ncbi:hypothetical protein CCR85_05115 [Rhodothalassium salexigens]|uniref:PEP-CTERM sorting domain-containing protein n=1 Tax=Rhodothalassium salexigens TaxID=1086 RepID=UPI0019116D4F|nr:PEP-CTERM sorting domain-containing protein [Rhodothalassium salexigens]MBK5910872.1 hypothetical protein [Rhodothalassium salexigens]
MIMVLRALLVVACFLAAAPRASAGPVSQVIDFRDQAFAAADGDHAYAGTLAGSNIGFTIKAYGPCLFCDWQREEISWRADDGFGIDSDPFDTRDHRINGAEMLVITFDDVVGLTGMMFAEFDHHWFWGTDVAAMVMDGDQRTQMRVGADSVVRHALDPGGDGAEYLDANNGEGLIWFDEVMPVKTLRLYSGAVGFLDDFALMGLMHTPVQVPVPATGLALGLGLGLVGLARRRRTA